MKRNLKKIVSSGLWLQPIVMIAIILYLKNSDAGALINEKAWQNYLFLSFIPTLYIWINSINKPSSQSAMQGKRDAMYPEVPKKNKFKMPVGVVFGKFKSKYICKELSEDGHVLVIGGSGSGKTSCVVIPTLLSNQKARIFAIDIKGELSLKTSKFDDQHILIFNPDNRNQFGYNPFYKLNKSSKNQTILEVMQSIACSLIPMPTSVKDPFWKLSARNLLTGLLLYYYKKNRADFINVVDEILSKPVKDSIDEVMNCAKPNSAEYRYIVQFSEIADETLSGIVTEMNNHLVIFANDQNIRFAFKNNPCKINPCMLEEGFSIYLSIREEKLSAYYDVLQLIINQTLAELETRPEDAEPVIVIIDELPRILSAGKIDRLLDAARTLRSRRVTLLLITQSTEALMSAYTENEVSDIISNCVYKVVLSASSIKTQKTVCQWCGKYKVKKRSWNNTGSNQKTSISYDEKDIVEPEDLVKLPSTGEEILIGPNGYQRIKKVPYYKDKLLGPLVEKNINYNKKEEIE